MKQKLFGLFILLFLSTQALAMQGHGFRIVSEKIEMSPGVQGGLIEQPWRLYKWASALTITSDKSGRSMEFNSVDAFHDISISNYTKQNQMYEYVVEVNCNGKSFRDTRHVEVYPGGSFYENAKSYIAVQEGPGAYRINAMTSISGESNSYHEAHAVLRVR